MKNAMGILQAAAREKGPLCVGLDTDPSYIPEKLLKAFGDECEAVLTYNRELIKRIAYDGSACCFKVQAAYYEAMGLKGMEVYSQTLRAVHEAGFIAIADVKRGDIAATAEAYARAHYSGDFEADIITLNPYMGFDTLKPFLKWCNASPAAFNGWKAGSASRGAGSEGYADRKGNGGPAEGMAKGAFVLLCTSNPGMKDIEAAKLDSGRCVRDLVGDELERLCDEWYAENNGEEGTEDCPPPAGAVVGCTNAEEAKAIRSAHPRIFCLIPGYGAQGGGAQTAAALLGGAGGVVNSSRGIICAWQKDPLLQAERESGALSISDMTAAASRAALKAKDDLLAAK